MIVISKPQSSQDSSCTQPNEEVVNPYLDIFNLSIISSSDILKNKTISQIQILTDFRNEIFNVNNGIVPSFFDDNKIYAKGRLLTNATSCINKIVLSNLSNGLARSLCTLGAIFAAMGTRKASCQNEHNSEVCEILKERSLTKEKVMDSQLMVSRKLNYFHPLTHFDDYLVKNYYGIDCTDMNQIRSALHALSRARDLYQSNISEFSIVNIELINQEIQRIADSAKQYDFAQYHDDSRLQDMANQFNSFLAEDPFAEEFKANPDLLNQVKQLKNSKPDSFAKLMTLRGGIKIPKDLAEKGFKNALPEVEELLTKVKGTLSNHLILNGSQEITDEVKEIFAKCITNNPDLIFVVNEKELALQIGNAIINHPLSPEDFKVVIQDRTSDTSKRFFVFYRV